VNHRPKATRGDTAKLQESLEAEQYDLALRKISEKERIMALSLFPMVSIPEKNIIDNPDDVVD